jgi:hypothetical protein
MYLEVPQKRLQQSRMEPEAVAEAQEHGFELKSYTKKAAACASSDANTCK